jgi:hypothetical protein
MVLAISFVKPVHKFLGSCNGHHWCFTLESLCHFCSPRSQCAILISLTEDSPQTAQARNPEVPVLLNVTLNSNQCYDNLSCPISSPVLPTPIFPSPSQYKVLCTWLMTSRSAVGKAILKAFAASQKIDKEALFKSHPTHFSRAAVLIWCCCAHWHFILSYLSPVLN